MTDDEKTLLRFLDYTRPPVMHGDPILPPERDGVATQGLVALGLVEVSSASLADPMVTSTTLNFRVRITPIGLEVAKTLP